MHLLLRIIIKLQNLIFSRNATARHGNNIYFDIYVEIRAIYCTHMSDFNFVSRKKFVFSSQTYNSKSNNPSQQLPRFAFWQNILIFQNMYKGSIKAHFYILFSWLNIWVWKFSTKKINHLHSELFFIVYCDVSLN